MEAILRVLRSLQTVRVERDAPLSQYTRFGLGGPAALLIDAAEEHDFTAAYTAVRSTGIPFTVIGGGSNLVCCDVGYPGVVLRYTGAELSVTDSHVTAAAGAELQALVDFSIARGLAGMHTMTGIPGWVGGAVYGNAGAYGRSMHQNVVSTRLFDGRGVRELDNAHCGFRYRHSTFKDHKDWIVLSTTIQLTPAEAVDLRAQADEILAVRNAKYPPTMKCAGSIFKNIILDELPPSVRVQVDPKVVREGKVPSAWFLEQTGAKGIRNGGIHVADYHANLIYNAGDGTACQVREIADELKARVRARFGFDLEEEVQYVGF